jgi:biotin carboxyl carrier protein
LRYEIEAGGRVRHVTADRTGDTFAVSVDGRLHRVDAARLDAHTLSLIVDSDVPAGRQEPAGRPGPFGPGKVYEATITSDNEGRVVVVNGRPPVAVRLNGRGGKRKPDRAAGSGPLRIAAPMPGKVVRVLVATGDAVRARQPLVVIEAMKMENQLRAGRDGTVTEIRARDGMLVEAGALLIVIQ